MLFIEVVGVYFKMSEWCLYFKMRNNTPLEVNNNMFTDTREGQQ